MSNSPGGFGASTHDSEAETELCRRFGQRIRLYGLRHFRSEAMAEDLVQQVLVLALDALRQQRVREADRLASFILGSCRMVAREARRGEARRQRLLEQYAVQIELAPEPAAQLETTYLVVGVVATGAAPIQVPYAPAWSCCAARHLDFERLDAIDSEYHFARRHER